MTLAPDVTRHDVNSSTIIPAALPVESVLPEFFGQLARGQNVVLVAPPGAGKTTRIPLALLEEAPAWLGGQRILLIEPRRVAVRGAARRMAGLCGEAPGGVIGYRTRVDGAVSNRTRIEVLTEGLFLRRLLEDPLLENIGIILFDEVHERSLESDTALAFCLDSQRNFRPDLRLVAMSATLDGQVFTKCLKAELIESEGRSWPVEIRHSRDIAHLRDLPEYCARTIAALWTGEQETPGTPGRSGSLLVFLPGLGEIRRVQGFLTEFLGDKVPVFPLYGEQSIEEQSLALYGPEGDGTFRRIVLATSIAETSVTVAGVDCVIDGGWRRLPRRDGATGLPRLQTCRIARATATQRAGRAGRQSSGLAVRLWSEMTQRSLIMQEIPAIREEDLADFALVTAAWQDAMGTAPEDLPLVEPPPAGSLAAGQALLVALGALNEGDKTLTPQGRRMLQFAAHPRLAAMLCAAGEDPSALQTAACLAALLEERDPLRKSPARSSANDRTGREEVTGGTADIRARLDLFSGRKLAESQMPRGVMRGLEQAAARFLRRAGLHPSEIPRPGAFFPDADKAGDLIVAGFPDRVAQLTGEGRYRLSGGGSARLAARDRLADEKLLAVAALHIGKNTAITLAAPLQAGSLPSALLARAQEQVETTLDGTSGKVMLRKRLRLGALVLGDRTIAAEGAEAAGLIETILLQKALDDLETILQWTEAVRQFQARIMLARTHYDPALPDLSTESLARNGDWLAPYLAGYDRLEQLREIDVLSVLRSLVDHAALRELDRQLPARLMLKTGKVLIDYTAIIPSISARAQAFYGVTELPRLAGGKVPLHAVLLSPAGRPQAVTADLARFWKNGWLDMRRDMRGRYPRHDWPENPV